MYRQLLSTLALVASVNGVAHQISVGKGGGLKFDPSEITAAVGDTLVFRFYDTSGPHDVVSGDFDSPCKPRAGAFYSGILAGDDDGDTGFVVDITSTDPFYFYCSVNRHCQSGMVGAVNAPSGQGAAAYLTAARRATGAENPNAVGGGTTTSIGDDDNDDQTSSTTSALTSSGTTAATSVTTTGTGGSTTTIVSSGSSSTSRSATSNAASTAAGTTAGTAAGNAAGSSASPTPTTTPNDAGRLSEGVVLGGLAAALGGFVALMA